MINSFQNQLHLHDQVKTFCRSLTYDQPSKIQAEVIEYLLNNPNSLDNLIIKAHAGTGKTLAYLIRVMQDFDFSCERLQAIILLPTRELAMQTSSYFQKYNEKQELPHKVIYKLLVGGSRDINEKPVKEKKTNYASVMNLIEKTQIIIGTVGKVYHSLISPLQQKKSKKKISKQENKEYLSNFKFLIIDEADKTMLQNKDNSLESMLNFIKFNTVTTEYSLVIVSASCTKETDHFFSRFCSVKKTLKENNSFIQLEVKSDPILGNPNESPIFNSNLLSSESRNNIIEYYHLFKTNPKITPFEQKYSLLFEILQKLKGHFKQALIFYNSKSSGEELCADLSGCNWSVTRIHGDLSQDQRAQIYEKVKNIEVKIVIATDLFSRGMDLSAVDLVINFDSPYNETEYYHRVGRTGRYNSYGIAISLFLENNNSMEMLIKINSEGKIAKIDQFNEEIFMEMREKFNKFKELSEISPLIMEKIHNLETPIKEEDAFVNKKRRREKFEKESIVSAWVDKTKQLYNENDFLYYQEDKEEEIVTLENRETKKCEYCLYCNLFKIFDV
jgi:superfamily II DNA/RNA helicase